MIFPFSRPLPFLINPKWPSHFIIKPKRTFFCFFVSKGRGRKPKSCYNNQGRQVNLAVYWQNIFLFFCFKQKPLICITTAPTSSRIACWQSAEVLTWQFYLSSLLAAWLTKRLSNRPSLIYLFIQDMLEQFTIWATLIFLLNLISFYYHRSV